MATTAASEVTDGPVLSLLNKRLRALRKKHNRILQMEDAISQGKTINKEQEEVLRSKPAVLVLMDEYEKLRQPMSAALEEELNLAVQRHQVSVSPPVAVDNDAVNKDVEEKADGAEIEKGRQVRGSDDKVVEDLLNLLYFGSLFDVKPQSDFTSTMLTRTHERGCCLTYDYVTDDETVLLGEKDLDTISTVSSLLISRPVHSALSHKNALQRCIEHAKLWLANSDDPIEAETTITYAGLRERLNKIMASDYFTTTPEMKAPVEVAAAGNYASFQVPVMEDDSVAQYQQQDELETNYQEHETSDNQSSPVEDTHQHELETESSVEPTPVEEEQPKPQWEEQQQYQREIETKEQQYIPRRNYHNQRGGRSGGGGGGRRGYPNGRGGRSGSRGSGSSYQNGRPQFYDHQPGNYYPRNYYNNRGRGGKAGGGPPYNNHGAGVQPGPVDVGLGS